MIKNLKDHVVIKSPFCGELHDILSGSEYSPNVAIAFDIKPTQGHYHNGFDEIYLVMEGSIILKLFDPSKEEMISHELLANELYVISKGVHHKISKATDKNRLCVITIPEFDPKDEIISDVI